MSQVIPLKFNPSINRDFPRISTPSYIDGEWIRFYNGLPRKIGGFQEVFAGFKNIIRSNIISSASYVEDDEEVHKEFCFVGLAPNFALQNIPSVYKIQVSYTNNLPIFSNSQNITPSDIGNFESEDFEWEFEIFTTEANSEDIQYNLVAFAGKNSKQISNIEEGKIYFGTVEAVSPINLLQIPKNNLGFNMVPNVSGGIFYISPILLAYGNDGKVYYSDPGSINFLSNPATPDVYNVTVVDNKKIVNIEPMRGSTSPAVLVWSVSNLTSLTYIEADTTLNTPASFARTTLAKNISIISAKSVVSYDQMYFWIGNNQFFVYTGTVKQLENTTNLEWFFSNLNWNYSARIWGTVNQKFSEIMWFFPKGNATECNHCIIYNILTQSWYDTPYERACAIEDLDTPYPTYLDSYSRFPAPNDTYRFYYSDYGTNAAYSTPANFSEEIPSYFVTGPLTTALQNNKNVMIKRIFPNFTMSNLNTNNQMSVQLLTQRTPDSDLVESFQVDFGENTEWLDVQKQARIIFLKFSANGLNSFFQMGQTWLEIEEGDTRF